MGLYIFGKILFFNSTVPSELCTILCCVYCKVAVCYVCPSSLSIDPSTTPSSTVAMADQSSEGAPSSSSSLSASIPTPQPVPAETKGDVQ